MATEKTDRGVERSVEHTLGHLRALDSQAGAIPRQDRSEKTLDPASRSSETMLDPASRSSEETRPATLEDLYREHRMRLIRIAVLLVDEQGIAEDVVQEAFTGLYRNWSGLRDAKAALGYLRTAVINGSRSVLRRRKTAREYTPPHQAHARSAESLAMLSAEHQNIVAALAKLPQRQREVLVLRYYGDMSESDIAEATGVSRGTVKSSASRALAALQRELREH